MGKSRHSSEGSGSGRPGAKSSRSDRRAGLMDGMMGGSPTKDEVARAATPVPIEAAAASKVESAASAEASPQPQEKLAWKEPPIEDQGDLVGETSDGTHVEFNAKTGMLTLTDASGVKMRASTLEDVRNMFASSAPAAAAAEKPQPPAPQPEAIVPPVPVVPKPEAATAVRSKPDQEVEAAPAAEKWATEALASPTDGRFNPEAFLGYTKNVSRTYEEKFKKMGIKPEDIAPEAWETVYRAVETAKDLTEKYRKGPDGKTKSAIATRMHRLATSLRSGRIAKNMEKAAEKVQQKNGKKAENLSTKTESDAALDEFAKAYGRIPTYPGMPVVPSPLAAEPAAAESAPATTTVSVNEDSKQEAPTSLKDIYGDREVPKAVAAMYAKLKGKIKREDFLKQKAGEEAVKRQRREARTEKAAKPEHREERAGPTDPDIAQLTDMENALHARYPEGVPETIYDTYDALTRAQLKNITLAEEAKKGETRAQIEAFIRELQPPAKAEAEKKEWPATPPMPVVPQSPGPAEVITPTLAEEEKVVDANEFAAPQYAPRDMQAEMDVLNQPQQEEAKAVVPRPPAPQNKIEVPSVPPPIAQPGVSGNSRFSAYAEVPGIDPERASIIRAAAAAAEARAAAAPQPQPARVESAPVPVEVPKSQLLEGEEKAAEVEKMVSERNPRMWSGISKLTDMYAAAVKGNESLRQESTIEPGAIPTLTDIVGPGEQPIIVNREDAPAGMFPAGERTPGEWRKTLRGLIEGAKEKVGMSKRAESLKARGETRLKELDAKAKKEGWVGGGFRALGKVYEKLPLPYKIAVGVALGAGAIFTSGVSIVAPLYFMGGIAGQRVAGMASMFLKIEKKLQGKAEKGADSAAAKTKKSAPLRVAIERENETLDSSNPLENIVVLPSKGSPEVKEEKGWKSKEVAMLGAALWSIGLGYAIKEGVEWASGTETAHHVQQWLADKLGHHELPMTGAPLTHAAPTTVSVPETAHAVPAVAAAETSSVVAEATSPEVPVLTTPASGGHGYEYMMKRMWQDMTQVKHLDPSTFEKFKGTDFYTLLTADEKSIDAVVHRIASDPSHGFYNADGTSAVIHPNEVMTVGANGQVLLMTETDVIAHAPEGAHVTPAYHPEAPVAHATETPVVPASNGAVSTPQEPTEEILRRASEQTVPKVDVTGGDTTGGPGKFYGTPPTEAAMHAPPSGQSPPPGFETPSPSPEAAPGEVVNKIYNLHIPTGESHIYAAAEGRNMFVFGGTHAERVKTITDYLSRNPFGVIFGPDATGVHRVPWFLSGGKLPIVHGPEMRTSSFLGFGSKSMLPPGPEDLKSLIK